jgi:hypothetical protein
MIGNICHATSFFPNKKPSAGKTPQETSFTKDSPIGISSIPTKPNTTFCSELHDQKIPQSVQNSICPQKYNSSKDLSLQRTTNTVSSTLATSFSGINFLDFGNNNLPETKNLVTP